MPCVRISSIADATDPFGYVAQAGYLTDSAKGLVLTTFRFYDPVAGRFINRDPTGYAGGVELYGYTQNNPENELDPSGQGESASPGSGMHRFGPKPCPATPCAPGQKFGATIGGMVGIAAGKYFSGQLNSKAVACLVAAIPALVSALVSTAIGDCFLPDAGDISDDVALAAFMCAIYAYWYEEPNKDGGAEGGPGPNSNGNTDDPEPM